VKRILSELLDTSTGKVWNIQAKTMTLIFFDDDDSSRKMRAKLNKMTLIMSIVPAIGYYLTGIFFIVLPIFIDLYRTAKGLEKSFGLPFKSTSVWNELSPMFE
jgi:hypothetical protein